MKPWAEKNGGWFFFLSTNWGFRKISAINQHHSGHPEVIADELVAAGHGVKHIDSTGRTENHDPHRKLPDFIVPCHEDEGGSSSRPRDLNTVGLRGLWKIFRIPKSMANYINLRDSKWLECCWAFQRSKVQEEERLRKLEKQRQAGELQRMEKSAVDRSSEAGHKDTKGTLQSLSIELVCIDIDTLICNNMDMIYMYVFI